MKNIKSLIDRASESCGGDTNLAKRMGVSQTVISDLRHERRTITPETAAELADLAGEDAREAAISAMLERSKGTRREGVLREILGKALAAGVAGVLVFSYSADSISATVTIAKSDRSLTNLYIVEYVTRLVQILRSVFYPPLDRVQLSV